MKMIQYNKLLLLLSLALFMFVSTSLAENEHQHLRSMNTKLIRIEPTRPSNYDDIMHRFLEEGNVTTSGNTIDEMKDTVTDTIDVVKDNLDNMKDTDPREWTMAQIIGLGVGLTVGLCLVGCIFSCFCRRCRR
mmetsp:Transcript_18161/g.20968  ORF Transcript_18161/g.20968 Transcript_18161/m.20968 type:complete len:133 (+) Transcript_18161:198-596(+)